MSETLKRGLYLLRGLKQESLVVGLGESLNHITSEAY